MSTPRHTLDRTTALVLRTIVVGYLVVAAGMAASGTYFFVTKSAVVPVLCLAALASSRFTAFVRDWAVFIALTMLFDAGRGLAFALIASVGAPAHMHYAIAAERWRVGGAVLPAVLQRGWSGGQAARWLDPSMVIVHPSHFVFFLTVGLVIWLRKPEAFGLYRRTMLIVMFAGPFVYVVVPTVPPWMAATTYGAIPPVESIALRLYNANVPTLTAALATNPIAAMPSLHAAFPFTCSLVAIAVFGRRARWALIYSVGVAVAVIYLGEHYLVDVLAGWLLGAAAFALAVRTSRAYAGSPSRSVVAAVAIAAAIIAIAQLAGLVKSRIEPAQPQIRIAA